MIPTRGTNTEGIQAATNSPVMATPKGLYLLYRRLLMRPVLNPVGDIKVQSFILAISFK
jgi:hypothetical protein